METKGKKDSSFKVCRQMHNGQKPRPVIRNVIQESDQPKGGEIIDPFHDAAKGGGNGSTGVLKDQKQKEG